MNHDHTTNPQTSGQDEQTELATVHPLPVTSENAQADSHKADQPEVLEGEVVSEEEYLRLRSQREQALERWRGYSNDARVAVAAVRTVATHPTTTTLGKKALVTGVTISQGLGSWARRAWDASTYGAYRRQMATAEAVGDQTAAAEWADRIERAKEQRHKRVMDLPRMATNLAKIALGSLATAVVLVLLTGMFVVLTGTGAFLDPIMGILTVIRWVFTAVSFAWTPLLMATPLLVLLAAWREGLKRGDTPSWLATAAEASADVPIDETTIAEALKALRIPQVRDHLKQGLPLQYLTPCRQSGRGTHAVIRLPSGVSASSIARRRSDLATGLHRLSKEVWPTTGSEEGILDLWIADKGALEEGAGPYPLLTEGTGDFFKGVPFGKTLRGDPVMAPMNGRNTIIGGMPDQGKSSASRVIISGIALDPTAELRIWIPDANFDFQAFQHRCSRYVMGAEDEKIAEILAHLKELHEEVQHRGRILVQREEPEVTRKLADTVPGLHPVVCLLEEAHVAIQHAEHGKAISKLLVDIVRLGRKRGIHLIVSTQAPTKASMPRDVTRNCSNGIAFAVGDHVANDALLGQGAYAAGHRATELIPGADKGTAVVKGFNGERSVMAQAYFVSVSSKNDQAGAIVARAMEAVAQRGALPGSSQEAPTAEQRDLLEDLAEVLGIEPVPTGDVPALLRELAPLADEYRGLRATTLRERLLDEYGIKVPSTANKYPLDPAVIQQALAARSTTDLDE